VGSKESAQVGRHKPNWKHPSTLEYEVSKASGRKMNIAWFVFPCLIVFLSINHTIGKHWHHINGIIANQPYGSVCFVYTQEHKDPLARSERDLLARFWGTSSCNYSGTQPTFARIIPYYCTKSPTSCATKTQLPEGEKYENVNVDKKVRKKCWGHKQFGKQWYEGDNPFCGKRGLCCRYDKKVDTRSACVKGRDGIRGYKHHVCVQRRN